MHATLVLLNWPLALRTRFGISQYPVMSSENKIYVATMYSKIDYRNNIVHKFQLSIIKNLYQASGKLIIQLIGTKCNKYNSHSNYKKCNCFLTIKSERLLTCTHFRVIMQLFFIV